MKGWPWANWRELMQADQWDYNESVARTVVVELP